MYIILVDSLYYVVRFVREDLKNEKLLKNYSDSEKEIIIEIDTKLEEDCLLCISNILSMFSVDNPIVGRALRLFDFLDFRTKDNQNNGIVNQILDSLEKVYEIFKQNNRDQLHLIYRALSKMYHITAAKERIEENITKMVRGLTGDLKDFIDKSKKIKRQTSQLISDCCLVSTSFNLSSIDPIVAFDFYMILIECSTNVFYPYREQLDNTDIDLISKTLVHIYHLLQVGLPQKSQGADLIRYVNSLGEVYNSITDYFKINLKGELSKVQKGGTFNREESESVKAQISRFIDFLILATNDYVQQNHPQIHNTISDHTLQTLTEILVTFIPLWPIDMTRAFGRLICCTNELFASSLLRVFLIVTGVN